jgi:hypothetical protein
MAGVLSDPRAIDHERRVLETGFEIAVRPFVGVLAERHLSSGR